MEITHTDIAGNFSVYSSHVRRKGGGGGIFQFLYILISLIGQYRHWKKKCATHLWIFSCNDNCKLDKFCVL